MQSAHYMDWLMHTINFLLIGLLFSATPLVAQVFTFTNVETPKRFSIIVNGGSGLSGTPGSLEDQMNATGLGDPDPSFCPNTNCRLPDSPEKETLIWAIGFDMRYLVTRTISIGIYGGKTFLGGAKGYRAADKKHLDSVWSTLSGALKVYWYPVGVVYLGAGPGWYRMESTKGGYTASKPGLAGEVGLKFPDEGRGFILLSVRGHLVSTEDIEHVIPGAAPESSVVPSAVTLHPDWSHVTVSLGFGLRVF